MTREQAITKLALHLMQCGMLMPIGWIDKNGEGSDTMLAFNVAMEALHEQAEREKGCEYCNSRFAIATHHITESGMKAGTNKTANFCPMCGKRLEEHHEAD